MAGTVTHVVRDLASLEAWVRRLYRQLRPSRLPVVSIELPQIPPERARSLSALANGYRAECGCGASGFFMSIAVVSGVLSFFLSGHSLSGVGAGDLLSLAGVTVLAALAGKLAGLLWARWRLLRIAASLRGAIAASGAPALADPITKATT